MARLVSLLESAYPDFVDAAVRSYASNNVVAGRWLEAEGLDLARSETERLLPQGIHTPGHQVFCIEDDESALHVGYLWMASHPRGSGKVAFIYQVMIHAEHRRKGHAKAAIMQASALAAEQGHQSIGLHVFAHNAPAVALYRSLGFEFISHNMSLKLPHSKDDA